MTRPTRDLKIFTGTTHPDLAQGVSTHLGLTLGQARVGRFADGEVSVEILENVRGKDTFVVQSTAHPCNDSLMEVLTLVDALQRSSACRITAALPYFAYSRQDRRPRSVRVPISAKLVADMLRVAGVDRVLMMDLHAEQIQGFFDIPVDNIYASPILLQDIQECGYMHPLIVSPDIGGVMRARAFAKRLQTDLAVIDKRRSQPNDAPVMKVIGDPRGRTCILVDDIIDTAHTLCRAAEALKKNGAERVVAYCTHPVLSGHSTERIEESHLDELVVTDTIPLKSESASCRKVRQLSVVSILAEAIARISHEESVSTLFVDC